MFRSSCDGNLGVTLVCGRKLGFPLELRRGSQGSYGVATGELGLLSSCRGELRVPLNLQWKTRDCF